MNNASPLRPNRSLSVERSDRIDAMRTLNLDDEAEENGLEQQLLAMNQETLED